MAVRRLVLGVVLGLAAAWAVPARAADPATQTQPLKTELFEDIVDGIGGVLGVLVGPPISSPSPYLNIPGALPEEPAVPVKVAAPPPAPALAPTPVAAPIVVPLPVVVAPVPSPQPVPQPAPKAVVAVPPPPAPPPRPAVPVVAAPVVAPPPPAVVTAPACAVRVAATATLEQMRRLPKCP